MRGLPRVVVVTVDVVIVCVGGGDSLSLGGEHIPFTPANASDDSAGNTDVWRRREGGEPCWRCFNICCI